MEINMHRDITHTGYKAKALFEKGEESWLRKAIVSIPHDIIKDDLTFVTDEYLKLHTSSHILPLWGGGFSLFALLLSSFIVKWDNVSDIFFFLVLLL